MASSVVAAYLHFARWRRPRKSRAPLVLAQLAVVGNLVHDGLCRRWTTAPRHGLLAPFRLTIPRAADSTTSAAC